VAEETIRRFIGKQCNDIYAFMSGSRMKLPAWAKNGAVTLAWKIGQLGKSVSLENRSAWKISQLGKSVRLENQSGAEQLRSGTHQAFWWLPAEDFAQTGGANCPISGPPVSRLRHVAYVAAINIATASPSTIGARDAGRDRKPATVSRGAGA
jgi:hypothetical protein